MTRALAPPGPDSFLAPVLGELVARFADGAANSDEAPALARLGTALAEGAPAEVLAQEFQRAAHAGFLRGAIVLAASALHQRARADLALMLGRELLDALDVPLGLALLQATLSLPEVVSSRLHRGGLHAHIHLLLGEQHLELRDPATALRHFEAVLAGDIDHRRALRGWQQASQALADLGVPVRPSLGGLARLEGVQELELAHGFGATRYEIGRPLGRGRHAIVYHAHDRHVGRAVAIKRLVANTGESAPIPSRVLQRRFFAEAQTLAKVRSPHVVALLDVQTRHQLIALELCAGGNLRQGLRRGLITVADLPAVGEQLLGALEAVHGIGAVHRDVKPANILVRTSFARPSVALADFGLAVPARGDTIAGQGGTLRYLAPELRRTHAPATPASDRFSAGVVLLELARYPEPLPAEFDRLDPQLQVDALVPDTLPGSWSQRLRTLLAPEPDARCW